MYSGASLTQGYGMQYRENFVHHSLEVPGLHGRGGNPNPHLRCETYYTHSRIYLLNHAILVLYLYAYSHN